MRLRPGQVGHRQLDAVQVAPRDVEVAVPLCAGCEHHRVEQGAQLDRVEGRSDVDARLEPRPLGHHLLQPAVDELLLRA